MAEFLPSDPSLYRHSNKGQDNSISNSVYQHHHGDNNRTGSGAVPNNNTMYEHGYENVREQHTRSNDISRMFYAQFGPPPSSQQPSHKLVDDAKAPDNVKKMSERMLKFTEFEVLANKLCPPQSAAQLIILAGMQANSGDDDSLDINLAFLHNIDRT